MGSQYVALLKMGIFKAFFLSALIIPFVSGDGHEECCDKKMVGNFEYTYVKGGGTSKYNCLQPCIYERMDKPGSRYCFAAGELEVTCEDDETEALPGGWTPVPVTPQAEQLAAGLIPVNITCWTQWEPRGAIALETQVVAGVNSNITYAADCPS